MARAVRRCATRRGGTWNWPRRTSATRSSWPRRAPSTSGTRSGSRSRCSATIRPPVAGSRRDSGMSSSTSSRTSTGPVDLPFPRRGHRRDRRLPGAFPGRPDGGDAAQLPLARPDPGRLVPPDPVQRSRQAGGAARDRQATGRASSFGGVQARSPGLLCHGNSRATTPCWSGRTPTPIRSCAR